MPSLQLTDNQNCHLGPVVITDKKGNPAAVQGAPVWASSDDTKLTVTASADGMEADISAVGPLGDVQVVVTADSDLGDGVTNITGTLDVTIVASQAVAIAVSAGAPTEQS